MLGIDGAVKRLERMYDVLDYRLRRIISLLEALLDVVKGHGYEAYLEDTNGPDESSSNH